MSHELYKRYRPKKLNQIVGQKNAVSVLEKKLINKKLPHSILLTGPSGVGKTTIARILRRELNCSKQDFNEINCADFKGIDTIREIRTRMYQAPINGDCRIWLIDEAHKLTGDAQNAFLKMLEDTPAHVYFMLATTEPQKLLKTVRTRCMEIALKPLSDLEINYLIKTVAKVEKFKIPNDVVNKILECSFGSARQALVILDKIIKLDNEEEMLDVIQSSTTETQAIAIARALFNYKTKWADMAKILKETQNEDPEGVRYLVLAYSKSILLSGGNLSSKAFVVIECFKHHFYDSKFAGLVSACYDVIVNGK